MLNLPLPASSAGWESVVVDDRVKFWGRLGEVWLGVAGVVQVVVGALAGHLTCVGWLLPPHLLHFITAGLADLHLEKN